MTNLDELRIDVAEIADAMKRGERVMFVDTRSPSSHKTATEQIPGSVRCPPGEIDARADELDTGVLTVAYCTEPNEKSSARAAFTLRDLGHSRAFALRGGFDAWNGAGLPVEPKNSAWDEWTEGPLQSPP